MEKTQGTELITHTQLENTPFAITGNEEQGYFLRLGDYRLTEFIKHDVLFTKLDNTNLQDYFLDYLEYNKWKIILTIIAAVEHANGNKNIKTES